MKGLIAQDIKFEKEEISTEKAREIFSAKGGSASGGNYQPFKLELIDELEKAAKKFPSTNQAISPTSAPEPHVGSTKEIDPDAFKLTKVAGAYWRGSSEKTRCSPASTVWPLGAKRTGRLS